VRFRNVLLPKLIAGGSYDFVQKEEMELYSMEQCVNVKGSVALAEENRDFVLGFVSQSRVSNDQSFIHFTPGM